MKKIAFQHKEPLSLKTVLGDSLSMNKLKSTIPEHVAPIEIFVVS
jgi:chromatin remodeling complex protein RSC6